MADGQILIDTRIRTDEVKQDTANLKKQLESLADSASASAKKIDRSFDNLSIDDAAEGLGESFEQEARKVEPIPEEIEKDFSKIDLEDVADGLGDGFEEEADKIKRESEKTETAVESLTDRISRQERELDSLKTAYVNARHEYGETADETQKLAREIEDLSGELAQSKREFSEAAQAADSFDRTLDDIDPPDKMESFFSGFVGGIGAGLTNAALGLLENAGEALVELGKQAVVASADIQAANAQFSQTFGSLEDTARAALQSVADETGILATRMQDSYTKIFAFTKTLGADTETAMDISGRAMKAAADQAAYYDKSIEEVTETLQSFLKGNYENDAALGIAATETTRNTKANEKYAKSFQKLSESQKVDVLLSMVEAGNEASGALGQAAREADQWSNVTGNLSEAWRQFLGVLGKPIVSGLTPVLQAATEGLQGITEGLNGLEFGTGFVDILAGAFQNLANATGIAAPSAEQLTQTLQSMGLMAEGTAADLEQLSAKEQEMALATEATEVAVGQLRQEYDASKESAFNSINSQVGLLDELATKSDKSAKDIVANWEKQKEALNRYSENMQRAVDMGLDEVLVQQLSDGSQQSMVILEELVNSTDVNVQEINAAFQGVQDAKDTVASTMAAIETDMSDKLSNLANDVSSQWGEMAGTVGASISEMQAYINSLQGKDVYVNVITKTISGTAVSGKPNLPPLPTARTANIPYLASGAVIPPNAPFAAVLGDQRNGTNLEAPEGLIRDIFREEMSDLLGSNLAGFESVVAELQATRAAIEDIQIGDTTIGRAAARYDRRQNLIRGGTTG